MMTTQSSQTKIWLKKLAVFPLLAGFIFLFAERVEAQEIIEIFETPIETIEEQVTTKKGYPIKTGFVDIQNNKYFYVDVNDNTKYYNKNGVLSDESGKILSNKKANASEVIPDNYTTKTYFNGKFFCEFYDDEANKKAKWQNLPNGDKIQIIEVREEEDISKEVTEIHKKGKIYIDAPIKDLQIEDLDPGDIRVKLKDINNLKINYLVKDTIIEKSIASEKNKSNEISEKEMGEYQNLVKKYGEQKSDITIFLEKDITKMKKLYGKMSAKQRQNSISLNELSPKAPSVLHQTTNPKFNKDWYIIINGQKYFYTFDNNERIARYYKNGKLVNLDIVKEYKKKHKIFENLKSTGKHYVFKSEKEKTAIDREFSDLGGMYFRMPRVDKNKVTRSENPIKPYVALRKNNKVFYKLKEDLTEEDKLLIPPPPPVPNATKEEIEKAKNAYEAWKKRTGNDFTPPPPPPVKKKQEAPENIKVEEKSIADFNIEFEKSDNLIKMKCLKGCEWEELNFNLNLKTPQIVNKYGLNKVNQRNKDDSFYFVLLQDKEIFDMKSTKNTKWKGLSGSSKEKMKLLINQNKVKSII